MNVRLLSWVGRFYTSLLCQHPTTMSSSLLSTLPFLWSHEGNHTLTSECHTHKVSLLDKQVRALSFCLSRNYYSVIQCSLIFLTAKSFTKCIKDHSLRWYLQEPEQLNVIFLNLSQVITVVFQITGADIRLVQLAFGLIVIFLKAIQVTTESTAANQRVKWFLFNIVASLEKNEHQGTQ